jgi:hypothetical protein
LKIISSTKSAEIHDVAIVFKTMKQMMPRTSFTLETMPGHPRFITNINLSDAIVITGAVTFVFSFISFFTLHRNKMEHEISALQIPTISLTGSYLPGDVVFTLGLHMMACLLILAYSGIYVVYDHKIRISELNEGLLTPSARKCKFHFWNTFMWRIGLLSSILLAVTGSIKLTLNSNLHGIIAFFMFLTQIIYMYLFYFKISKFLTSDTYTLWLQFLSLFCVPLVVVVYVIAGVVLSLCWTYACRSFAVNVHVALEYAVTLAIAVFIHSLRKDLSAMAWAAVLTTDDEDGDNNTPAEAFSRVIT